MNRFGQEKWLLANEKFDLAGTATSTKKLYDSNKSYRARLATKVAEIGQLQYRLAAARRQSMLFVFEGLDAAGKNGTIRRVFADCDPQSCRFSTAGAPTEIERQHDFLWRFNQHLPAHGEVGVFNRSHYGDAVIPRVHPELLDDRHVASRDRELWERRYRSIIDWEAHLTRNDIHVIKIFLHISHDEQHRRLLKRLDDAGKSWKAEIEDVCDHHQFANYLRYYTEAISRTTSEEAPWLIVPADDKSNMRLIVADIVLRALQSIHPVYPPISKRRAKELDEMRDILLDKSSAGRKPCVR